MTSVLAYDHSQTGKPYLMVINKDIHLDNYGHDLMCPMRFRTNGIKINETSKFHSKAKDESTHDLQLEDPSD